MFILFLIIVIALLLVGLFAVVVNFKRRRGTGIANDQSGMVSERGKPEAPKVGRASGPD